MLLSLLNVLNVDRVDRVNSFSWLKHSLNDIVSDNRKYGMGWLWVLLVVVWLGLGFSTH